MVWAGVVRLTLAILASAVMAGTAAAQISLLEYAVRHPVTGTIGKYANRIERRGEVTTVATTLRVLVDVAGIALHREEAERTEHWHGSRLIRFDGLTTTNGTPWRVHGEAQGDRFVVTSPAGVATAPGDVMPSNAWSCAFVHGKTILAVDTGKVEPVRVAGGEPVVVAVNERPISARHYRIDGATAHHQVWLDARCVPVLMITGRDDIDISLSLVGETEPQ